MSRWAVMFQDAAREEGLSPSTQGFVGSVSFVTRENANATTPGEPNHCGCGWSVEEWRTEHQERLAIASEHESAISEEAKTTARKHILELYMEAHPAASAGAAEVALIEMGVLG